MKKKLYYYYDSEADVLYFAQGKPSSKDKSIEVGNDVVLRVGTKDKKVKGFTVLNLSARAKRQPSFLPLPLSVMLEAA